MRTQYWGGIQETSGILCAERISDGKEFVVVSASGRGKIDGSANGQIETLNLDEVKIYRKKDGVRYEYEDKS